MKILWITNIPSPYRVDFFNELGKHCKLTVLFEKKASTERDKSWGKIKITNFKAVFLKGKSVGVAEAFCPDVARYLRKGIYDYIVVTDYSDPTGVLAILTLKIKGIRYCIEGDGAFAGSGKGIKEALKKWIISGAELCFSTSEEHDKYYKQYGAKRIVRYPFTSVKRKDVLERPLSTIEKKAYKRKLGVKEEKMVLAVGQMIHRKGFDILIRACAGMDGVGCYIVGGKAPEKLRELGTQNIHFVDFMTPDKLKDYYMAADVFVHPTREDIWGLVVNEAMANGLPVITTNHCIAGLELITSEEYGEIVPVEDVGALREAIRKAISKNYDQRLILDRIGNYTIERMAKRHMDFFVIK